MSLSKKNFTYTSGRFRRRVLTYLFRSRNSAQSRSWQCLKFGKDPIKNPRQKGTSFLRGLYNPVSRFAFWSVLVRLSRIFTNVVDGVNRSFLFFMEPVFSYAHHHARHASADAAATPEPQAQRISAITRSTQDIRFVSCSRFSRPHQRRSTMRDLSFR